MKLKVFAMTLILTLLLNITLIMPVSANNFTGDYGNTVWYQALIRLLVDDFPSLFDKAYVNAILSKGEPPVNFAGDYDRIPYKCYFFNPGDEANNVLEAYVLCWSDSNEGFFFMTYKYNEATGKYEFDEQIWTAASVSDSEKLKVYSGINASVTPQYGLMNLDDDIIDYAQNVYNTEHGIKTSPETGDAVAYYFIELAGIAAVIFLRFNLNKKYKYFKIY
ncbi:MAG: hypothetical protein FWD71_01560 [Oscillospiraceae bacterium]|nr:hypothetical protein [Oscillospiraceae bacterium]